jgi:hypothetical protein
MRLRAHRRNLAVWSPSVGPADRYSAPRLTRLARTRRIRSCIRTGALLTVIGLMRLARGLRPRWRPLLAGTVLTVIGVMLRSSAWSAVVLPGLWFFAYALLIPARPDADRKRRSELERELAGYSTPAQRWDLEAILDRYPDDITYELRDILASQALAACQSGIPGAGRY